MEDNQVRIIPSSEYCSSALVLFVPSTFSAPIMQFMMEADFCREFVKPICNSNVCNFFLQSYLFGQMMAPPLEFVSVDCISNSFSQTQNKNTFFLATTRLLSTSGFAKVFLPVFLPPHVSPTTHNTPPYSLC